MPRGAVRPSTSLPVSRWRSRRASALSLRARRVASSAEAIARNPGAGGAIRGALLLGLVLIESLALYTLVIIFAGF